MPNRLARESSPYLLQHANNPVDWYPWCDEALQRAAEEDRPIFLSVGYSACHWCHVMERESFESEQVAQQLNQAFICIKVDREERPDIDQIYMNAVQLMTGRGGWPMSVFLTPERQPFYGGTYWPPEPRHGMPSFSNVIDAVLDAWSQRRDQIYEQAGKLTAHLQTLGRQTQQEQTAFDVQFLQRAAGKLEQVFDPQHGGFGRAPKFPHSMDLSLLMRLWSRDEKEAQLGMVTLTLDQMKNGGIYDHLGGGFARYSTDDRWLIPHFEKMLYDNALLTGNYLDAFVLTGNPEYAQVARETCDYVLREMTDDEGGFHSSEDADSEGQEGKFYVWTPEEVLRELGDAAGERFCRAYDVTPEGNFEGHSVLNLPQPISRVAELLGWEPGELESELEASREKLRNARNQRVRPAKDDKVLCSWNALMIDSLARAGRILNQPAYLAAATRAAEFILKKMRRHDGRLYHSWRDGKANHPGYLDDHAYMIHALQSLYEATLAPHWLDEASSLADIALEHFADAQNGGFFYTSDDHETLITRTKDLHDSSVPSGNGMIATALLRLGKLLGSNKLVGAAAGTLEHAKGVMAESPTAAGQLLIGADWMLGPVRQMVLIGQDEALDTFITSRHRCYLPRDVFAGRPSDSAPPSLLEQVFQGKSSPEDVAAFVCRDFECDAPVRGRAAVAKLFDQLGPAWQLAKEE